jgi:glycosyltransferase involved in cell wall biosynthesis
MLFESFAKVIDDPRISEIVISDDASDMPIFQQVKGTVSAMNAMYNNKIRLYRNLTNADCYVNKMTAINLATNDALIVLDSDNVIDKSYLDALYSIPLWNPRLAYAPSFAKPLFDYRPYEGEIFDRRNIAHFIDKPMVSTCLNTMNYFVCRTEYLKVWQRDIDPHTADSILQNYNWMAAGYGIFIVPGMHYEHRVHDGSHYKINNHKTGDLYKWIEEKIKALK